MRNKTAKLVQSTFPQPDPSYTISSGAYVCSLEGSSSWTVGNENIIFPVMNSDYPPNQIPHYHISNEQHTVKTVHACIIQSTGRLHLAAGKC